MTQSPQPLLAPTTVPTDAPIVFFDGVCGLCNQAVDFLVSRDRKHGLRFAPLQGETSQRLLNLPDAYGRSLAVLRNSAMVPAAPLAKLGLQCDRPQSLSLVWSERIVPTSQAGRASSVFAMNGFANGRKPS